MSAPNGLSSCWAQVDLHPVLPGCLRPTLSPLLRSVIFSVSGPSPSPLQFALSVDPHLPSVFSRLIRPPPPSPPRLFLTSSSPLRHPFLLRVPSFTFLFVGLCLRMYLTRSPHCSPLTVGHLPSLTSPAVPFIAPCLFVSPPSPRVSAAPTPPPAMTSGIGVFVAKSVLLSAAPTTAPTALQCTCLCSSSHLPFFFSPATVTGPFPSP